MLFEKMHSVYEADWLSIISSNTSKHRTYCKFFVKKIMLIFSIVLLDRLLPDYV